MEKMTPEEAKISSAISSTLANVLILLCKNHIVQNVGSEDKAVSEVMAAITALICEMMHTLYDDDHVKSSTELFCKTLKYALYMYDQAQGDKNV